MMEEFSWDLFYNSGSVDAFVLYKKLSDAKGVPSDEAAAENHAGQLDGSGIGHGAGKN